MMIHTMIEAKRKLWPNDQNYVKLYRFGAVCTGD